MRADRPLVIDHVQHARRPKHRREIQRVMKVALRRRAIADPRANRPPLAAIGKRHRRADRLRQLRADRAGNRNHIPGPPTVVHRHLPALGVVARVADRLAHHRQHRHAANQQHARLAITGKQQVVANVRRRAGHRHGFLAVARKVERQPPLPLHRDHPRIEVPRPHHHFQAAAKLLRTKLRLPRSAGHRRRRPARGSSPTRARAARRAAQAYRAATNRPVDAGSARSRAHRPADAAPLGTCSIIGNGSFSGVVRDPRRRMRLANEF